MYKIICEPFRSISPITVPIVEERQWITAKTFQNIELSQVRQSSSSLTLPFTYHDYKSTVRNQLLTTVQDNIYVLHTKTDQFRVVASRSRISFFKSPYGGPQTSMVTFCLRAKFHHHHQSVLSAVQQNQLLDISTERLYVFSEIIHKHLRCCYERPSISAHLVQTDSKCPLSPIYVDGWLFLCAEKHKPPTNRASCFLNRFRKRPRRRLRHMFRQITLRLQHFPHSTFYVFRQCIKNVSVHRFFYFKRL